jgi:hypothetical protein
MSEIKSVEAINFERFKEANKDEKLAFLYRKQCEIIGLLENILEEI